VLEVLSSVGPNFSRVALDCLQFFSRSIPAMEPAEKRGKSIFETWWTNLWYVDQLFANSEVASPKAQHRSPMLADRNSLDTVAPPWPLTL